MLEAAWWYEQKRGRLGDRLVDEVLRVGALLDEQPRLGRRVEAPGAAMELREFGLRTFPYVLVYTPDMSPVLILVVRHTRREPGYWMERVANTPPPEAETE